mgnify:CR=1 FL=1|jgi:hypothetical protein
MSVRENEIAQAYDKACNNPKFWGSECTIKFDDVKEFIQNKFNINGDQLSEALANGEFA